MCMMCCGKCGSLINTDDNPESFYMDTPDGKEIELDNPLCDDCKEQACLVMEDKNETL